MEQFQMTSVKQRVNYDLIAHLYDEPGRNHDADPNLAEFINEKTRGQPSNCRVLDMGCGTGKQLNANHDKFSKFQAVGLDLFHGMLLQARKRCAGINWVQGDSANPPFANGSFGYITNQFSYHHVQDKDGMIRAIFRILKPGGRFVITNLDPWSMLDWIVYTYFPESRLRDLADFLPVDQLTALMQETGFCNIHVRYKHSQSEENLNDFLTYASQRHRTSQLIAIPDHAYEEGIAKLKEYTGKVGMGFRVSSEICLVWITGDKPG
jgi:ubiquinone/menaquinone biosynthesis C-methylase UbiE